VNNNVGNITVLRRVLKELEGSLIRLDTPIQSIDPLVTNSNTNVIAVSKKLNQVIDVVNAISTALNQTRKNNF